MPCLKYFFSLRTFQFTFLLSFFTGSFAQHFFPVKNKWIFLSIYTFIRYKYTYMEEMLSNVAGARQIFERWMEWEPDEQAWHSYINMELRYKETDRARNIYERYVMVHPEVKNWVKYAKFEERQSNIGMEYNKEMPLGGRGEGEGYSAKFIKGGSTARSNSLPFL